VVLLGAATMVVHLEVVHRHLFHRFENKVHHVIGGNPLA